MAIVVPGEKEILDAIASDRGGNRRVLSSWLNENVKALSLNGLSSDIETRQSGLYPALLPIYLLALTKPTRT